jgi:hypothetical protein
MQTYILRVYRARPNDVSVSGMIEDIESGQKKHFNSLNDLLTILAKSLGKGQLELPELTIPDPVAMTG